MYDFVKKHMTYWQICSTDKQKVRLWKRKSRLNSERFLFLPFSIPKLILLNNPSTPTYPPYPLTTVIKICLFWSQLDLGIPILNNPMPRRLLQERTRKVKLIQMLLVVCIPLQPVGRRPRQPLIRVRQTHHHRQSEHNIEEAVENPPSVVEGAFRGSGSY